MAYRRSQITWALWYAFGPITMVPGLPWSAVPSSFKRKVSNIIDLGMAAEVRPGLSGVDRDYDLVEACEVGVGLDLHDMGFPHSTAFAVMGMVRDQLRV